MPGRDLLERVHVLTHKVAGDGFLLAQDIREHLKRGPRVHHDLPLIALLPCLEEFVRTAHALADLDGEAWPAWWPKDWPESQLEGPRKETH
jgi:hypothetical protein